jgi:hypothetical protein
MNRTRSLLFSCLATTTLIWGAVAGVLGTGTAHAQPRPAPLDHGPFAADDGGWGPPHHWCPGQLPVPHTGNERVDPLNWDWNICHTYYWVWSGMGNVSNGIWDGDNPPPRPAAAPGLNFCPIPPWCP